MTYRQYEPPDGQEIPDHILEDPELRESFLNGEIFVRYAEKDHEDSEYPDPWETRANVDSEGHAPEGYYGDY